MPTSTRQYKPILRKSNANPMVPLGRCAQSPPTRFLEICTAYQQRPPHMRRPFSKKGQLPMNPKKEAFRRAFIASVPILCSYLFLGMAYGILMQEAGFGWAASFLTSAVVYTGAFQFVLITFLANGTRAVFASCWPFRSRRSFISGSTTRS